MIMLSRWLNPDRCAGIFSSPDICLGKVVPVSVQDFSWYDKTVKAQKNWPQMQANGTAI